MELSPKLTGTNKSTSRHHLNSPTLTLLVAIAAMGALLYASFLLNPQSIGDFIPYIIVIAAEVFIIFQALIALWTILSGGFNPRDYEYFSAKRNLFKGSKPVDAGTPPTALPLYLNKKLVTVDIFIPVYGEPLEKIEATITAARDVIGLHGTYVLDDGKSNAVRDLAEREGVGYIRRPVNRNYKAGNINYALHNTSADFFIILDADFVVKPEFISETLPFFTQQQVAFVQTPQHYGNLHNVISRGAGYMQNVFYRLIQPGKNRFDAAFCVGTNVIFRSTSINEIGGMYESSKSEDIWTSLLLHEKGLHSVYIGDILATGDAPDTIESYMKQQLRWATGGFEILLKHNLITSKLTVDQKLQYLSTTSYYLHGLAIFMLMLLPPLHIIFNISPVNLAIGFAAWLMYYLAFYAMQVVVAFYTVGGFRLETIILAMVSFPVYLKALVNVVLGKDVAWRATGNRTEAESPFNFIIPQVHIFIFLTIISLIGIWKTFYTGSLSLSLFWNLLNNVIFGAFIYMAWQEIRNATQNKKETRGKITRERVRI